MPAEKMHADEVDIDSHLVRRLLVGQFPPWAHLTVEPVVSAGTVNAIYRLGDDMAVRLPRIHWGVNEVDKEHEWLSRLAPLLPIDIPEPLAKGEPAGGYPWPWSVYRWLEGESPSVGNLVDPGRLATDLADFVTAFHQIDPTGNPPIGRGEHLAVRDTPTRRAIAELHGMVDINAVTGVWDEALATAQWSGRPVLVHGDLMPGNLLMVGGCLAGVIDFGTLGAGDPACDLIVAWNLLPADARSIFRSALGVDDATWLRGRGWALSMAVIALPYYETTNPVMADNARHVIREVLSDDESGC
jgi:aminoglycoside phosphotransferase (APT) family kinase protein